MALAIIGRNLYDTGTENSPQPENSIQNVTPPRKVREMGSDRGFTLIEIAVVLVIIGLIVGGILVGQSLIAGAQLRAQVTQFERFNQAAAGTDVLKRERRSGTAFEKFVG